MGLTVTAEMAEIQSAPVPTTRPALITAPRCGGPRAPAESRSHPGRPGTPSGPGLFFKLHPRVPLPAGDRGLVVPPGRAAPASRHVEPRSAKEATDVRGVVGDAEFLLQDGGDPPGRPQIVRNRIRARARTEETALTADVAAGSASAGARTRVSPPGLRDPGDAASHATATRRSPPPPPSGPPPTASGHRPATAPLAAAVAPTRPDSPAGPRLPVPQATLNI